MADWCSWFAVSTTVAPFDNESRQAFWPMFTSRSWTPASRFPEGGANRPGSIRSRKPVTVTASLLFEPANSIVVPRRPGPTGVVVVTACLTVVEGALVVATMDEEAVIGTDASGPVVGVVGSGVETTVALPQAATATTHPTIAAQCRICVMRTSSLENAPQSSTVCLQRQQAPQLPASYHPRHKSTRTGGDELPGPPNGLLRSPDPLDKPPRLGRHANHRRNTVAARCIPGGGCESRIFGQLAVTARGGWVGGCRG